MSSKWLILVLLAALAIGAGRSVAAWLRPLEGDGNFRFTCDLVSLPRPDGTNDVVALVAVRHRELTFVSEAGTVRARLRATAALRSPDGREVTLETSVRLVARNESEAGSPTLHQVFTMALREVDFSAGEFQLTLEDLNRQRPGLAYLGTQARASARLVADWYAPPPGEPSGLSVGDAIFLAHAPIRLWEEAGRGTAAPAAGPWDYANPPRRYGLEAEAVQVYFVLEPPAAVEDRRRAATRDLRLEVVSERLDLALVDTLRLTPAVRASLGAGNAAAVYWEMDAGGLPPGSYRLGIAPLDTAGRALLTGFDVVWRLEQVARDPRLLAGEGRTVFYGDDLRRFESATDADREALLAAFWRELDPSPDDPYNEAYAEFQRRVAYVRLFLGGFDEAGARDPRGHVYLLLGEPSSVLEEPVPMNHHELEDARVLVYERYGPQRSGSLVRGGGLLSEGVRGGNVTTLGSIPMPYSYLADVNIRAKKTAADTRVFQLWRYDDAGQQLFPNIYSGKGGGLRFLFLDRTGRGDFVLDSTNTRLLGD